MPPNDKIIIGQILSIGAKLPHNRMNELVTGYYCRRNNG